MELRESHRRPVQVELMGALQKRSPGQEWSPPTDPARHRGFVLLATGGSPSGAAPRKGFAC